MQLKFSLQSSQVGSVLFKDQIINKMAKREFENFHYHLRNPNLRIWHKPQPFQCIKSLYFPGTKSTSTTTSFTLHEFTQNLNLMRWAQEDVNIALNRHSWVISYASIVEMKFIDLCVKETIWKHIPPFSKSIENARKSFQFPERIIKFEKEPQE